VKITDIIARVGWQVAAASPLVGPYVIAAQDDRVAYVREVTDALESGVVYSREDGHKLSVKLDELAPVPVDWRGTC
jgi:hypothetical protein